ncbi:MAG: Fic family protein [Chloroflexota bacterium]|nr:Fic family protein [Chloroflexota bacterium]
MRGSYTRRTWRFDPALYAPARYRRACSYDAFVPEPIADLAIELPGDVVGALSDAEKAIADLNGRAGPELAPLARLLLRTESIGSSKVEGMQADARTLARAEANRDTGRNIGPLAAEIIANIDAMEWAAEEAVGAENITRVALQDIHRILLADEVRQRPGEFRDEQNWIGGNDYNPCGADFVPPPPEHVLTLVDDLCQFCNDEALSPLLQAAIAHAQFETIHPFGDGNGRTGRALVQVLLRRRGLAPSFVPPISVVLARRRDRYIEGLTRFREDRTAEWVEIFATATAEAARLADDYRGRVAALQDAWREQLRADSGPRSDAAAWALIDALPAHPVLTVAVAVAATGRTRPAVNNGIAELEAAGVLAPLGTSRRNRAWEAEGLLDLIAGLEAGER